MLFAVLFPITPRVRMAIEREDKKDNRINIAGLDPRIRPALAGNAHPSRCASQLCLGLGLFCVSLLNAMTRKQAIYVSGLSGLHGGRTRC